MTLESDLEILSKFGIVGESGLNTIKEAINRERDETYTKKGCPLADQFEATVSKAAKKPQYAIDLLIPLFESIQERNKHFGQ